MRNHNLAVSSVIIVLFFIAFGLFSFAFGSSYWAFRFLAFCGGLGLLFLGFDTLWVFIGVVYPPFLETQKVMYFGYLLCSLFLRTEARRLVGVLPTLLIWVAVLQQSP